MSSTDKTKSTSKNRDLDKDIKSLSRKFNSTIRKAQAAIFWERAWPKAVAPLCTTGLFLTASWAGMWQPLPPAARMAGVLTFAAATLISPFLIKTGSLKVTREDALKRIDNNMGSERRPARTLNDRIHEKTPETAKEVWKLHLLETWEKYSDKFSAGKPKPNVSKNDPFRIRFAVLAATLITGAMANGEHLERIADAFDWDAPPVYEPPLEVKAWVAPPKNINVTPCYITDSDLNNCKLSDDSDILTAHEDSKLTILVFSDTSKEVNTVKVNGVKVPVQKTILPREKGDKTTFQYEIKLSEGDTKVAIKDGPEWEFQITPDNNPTADIISVDIKVEEEDENKEYETIETYPSLQVECTADDDYGIEGGKIIIRKSDQSPDASPLPSAELPTIELPKNGLCNN
jgi:hypothetical protein